MDRSDAKSVIVQSDSYFYKKIIKKYQTGEIRDLNFPRMIYCKNVRYPFPQTINVNVHLQLHLNSQSKVPSLVKPLVPRTVVTKNESSEIIKPTVCHFFCKITNFKKLYTRKLDFSSPVSCTVYKNLALNLQQIRDTAIKPLLLTLNQVFNSQTNIIPSSNVIINPQMSNHGNNTKLLNSQMFRGGLNYGLLNSVMQTIYLDKKTHKNQYRQPSILSQYNLFFNSTMDSIDKLFFKNPNQATVNQHLLKNYYGSFKNFESGFVHRAYSYKTDNENLHFQDSRRLESEIELIKKIVTQTKESVLEKIPPAIGEAEIKRHIDINRISDQVYQNLERKIRIERERRGV